MTTINVQQPRVTVRNLSLEKQTIHAYADFLDQQDWSVFCTFTTWNRLSWFKARKLMERLQETITKKQGGVLPTIFFVSEPSSIINDYHVHALVKVEGDGERAVSLVKEAWKVVCPPSGDKKYNRSDVQTYVTGKGGNYYMIKHLNKKTVDYGFL
jgi:hypothetical protein